MGEFTRIVQNISPDEVEELSSESELPNTEKLTEMLEALVSQASALVEQGDASKALGAFAEALREMVGEADEVKLEVVSSSGNEILSEVQDCIDRSEEPSFRAVVQWSSLLRLVMTLASERAGKRMLGKSDS